MFSWGGRNEEEVEGYDEQPRTRLELGRALLEDGVAGDKRKV